MPLELTDEQIAQLLEQQTAQPDDPASDPKPALKYRLGNQTFEAKTPEELQAQLDAAMAQIGTTVQQLQARATPAAPTQQPAAPQFDKEHYAKLFLENPLDAAEYMDTIRFGVNKPADVFKTVIKDVGAMEQALSVQQFMSNTEEYTPTPENFSTLQQYMAQYNLPWTASGMKLAFGQAKLDGKIRTEEEAPQQSSQFGMSTRRGVPTVPRGSQLSSSAVDQDLMGRFESLTPDKMKQFLEGLGNR